MKPLTAKNATPRPTTAARDIQELMDGWDKIMAAARREFPHATEEQLYQVAHGAMKHALGL